MRCWQRGTKLGVRGLALQRQSVGVSNSRQGHALGSGQLRAVVLGDVRSGGRSKEVQEESYMRKKEERVVEVVESEKDKSEISYIKANLRN